MKAEKVFVFSLNDPITLACTSAQPIDFDYLYTSPAISDNPILLHCMGDKANACTLDA
jgi:hypothetical protein